MIVDIENVSNSRRNSLIQRPLDESPKSLPTLVCIKFHEKFELDLADAVVGTYCMKKFKLKNPRTDSSISIVIDKVSSASGLTVGLGPSHSENAVMMPEEDLICTLFWKPITSGRIRETMVLKMDNKIKLQFVVYGNAVSEKVIIDLTNRLFDLT